MGIGQNIKLHRERLNLTQEELAFKTRIGKATIEKYETGEYLPDLQTVLRISTVMDIPASELLEQETQNESVSSDKEIEQLVKEIGLKRAKMILRKTKEFSEEDFLHVMQMLYEIKYAPTNS